MSAVSSPLTSKLLDLQKRADWLANDSAAKLAAAHIELSKNGIPIPVSRHLIPVEGRMTSMANPIPVQSASAATHSGYLEALRRKVRNSWHWVSEKTGEISRATRLDKAWARARTAASWLYSKVTSFVRTAGVIPLSILALTTERGQQVIKSTAGFAVRAADKVIRGIGRAFGWVARKFGKPGNTLADKVTSFYNRTVARAKNFIDRITEKVRKYTNPERGYMRVAKVLSFATVAIKLVVAAGIGVWTVPVAALAGALGVAMDPTLRAQFTRSVRKAKEINRVNELVGEQLIQSAESIMNEYGPDLNNAPQSVRDELDIRFALIRHVDGDKDAFNDLNKKKRQRAQALFVRLTNSVEATLLAEAEAAKNEITTLHEVIDGELVSV